MKAEKNMQQVNQVELKEFQKKEKYLFESDKNLNDKQKKRTQNLMQ